MTKEILAPSYGTVIDVKNLATPRILIGDTEQPEKHYKHVSIFLAVWDNHDQFIPYPGMCIDSIYKKGEFNLAHMLGKSDKNERWQTVFKADFGKYVVTQIAGLVAKRIVNKCKVGSTYLAGEVYGEILLGSRVDITLPADRINILVRKNQNLQGGQTVLATYLPVLSLTP
jgi:phosphatidylserine decarboxylase